MSKPITITELKKELKKLNQADLMNLIIELYHSNSKVKEFVSSRFKDEDYQNEVLGEYKRKKFLEFFDKGFRTPSIKKAKELLNDYKKFASFERVLSLMLWFVECGTGYTKDFGDMDQAYYNSLCRVYEEFISILRQMGSKEHYSLYKERVHELVSEASDIAWGYGEFIVDCSSDFY